MQTTFTTHTSSPITIVNSAVMTLAMIAACVVACYYVLVQIDVLKADTVIRARVAETALLKEQNQYALIKMKQTGCESAGIE